jgi:uncharacterized protein YndB with AHSA1/START domain
MPTPTGRIVRIDDSTFDLTLTRVFAAGHQDLWDSVTDPRRTADWFGTWRGDAKPGGVIEVQMRFEEGLPWMSAKVDECEAPHLLALSVIDEAGGWQLELRLTQRGDDTELVFVQHLEDPASADSIGPGWEYYLDNLVAARGETALPDFGDYYPDQAEYYRAEAARAIAPQTP